MIVKGIEEERLILKKIERKRKKRIRHCESERLQGLQTKT